MIRAIVTDIEGTTSSLSFVKEVLFPYAREHLGDYLRTHTELPAVVEQLDAIRDLAGSEADIDDGRALGLEAIIALLNQWIDADRKLTPLKALQGLVWEQGYRNGDFHGHVFADAVQCLRAWHDQGIGLYVYSSGSVYAQKLLFSHTGFGDLTPLFEDYFDTRIGAKGEAGSYRRIVAAVGIAAEDILFLSDIDTELAAAQQAGLATWQLVREGEGELDAGSPYRQARTFEEIVL